MSLSLYADVHVPLAVTVGLRIRDVDVLTAQEDGRGEAEDEALLTRAVELARILVTQDRDFLAISAEWQREEKYFHGIVYAPQTDTSIGAFITDLELIAKLGRLSEFENRVEHLPY